MGLVQAVGSVFRKYATFSGRARRSEYWWFWLFVVLLETVALNVDQLVLGARGDETRYLSAALGLALFLPMLAVSVRRLHDTDRSGWWYLLNLIPVIGQIFLFVFYVLDSREPNRFGPPPKVSDASS